MADEQNHGAGRKQQLIAELDRARANMSRNFGYVRYRAAVNDRLKDSLRTHSRAWLSGALVTGLLAGWRLISAFKPRKVYIDASTGKKAAPLPKKGFLLGLFSFLFALVQPALVTIVSKRLNLLAQKHGGV